MLSPSLPTRACPCHAGLAVALSSSLRNAARGTQRMRAFRQGGSISSRTCGVGTLPPPRFPVVPRLYPTAYNFSLLPPVLQTARPLSDINVRSTVTVIAPITGKMLGLKASTPLR